MVKGRELQRTYNGAVEDHTGGSTVGLTLEPWRLTEATQGPWRFSL
jgi:hypothetical protein